MSAHSAVLSLVFLAGCGTSLESYNPDYNAYDDYGKEYDYVLGYDEESADTIEGGAHFIADFSVDYREAIGTANKAAKIHPALVGDMLKLDKDVKAGETDWDVFASSWWSQSKNGIARRWTGGSQDYQDLSDKDNLSPAEKYDFLFHPGQQQKVEKAENWDYAQSKKDEKDRGPKTVHPEITVMGPATRWELKNHGVYQEPYLPEGWWGHCNGWASYVTTEKGGAPKRDIRVKIVDGKVAECAAGEDCVLVRMGDIEALMTEVYFNDQATFGGQRCQQSADQMERDEYGRPTDPKCRDINAGTFHVAAVGLLGKGAKHLNTNEMGRPSFVIDHSYDYQVWNYPVVKFEIKKLEEITKEKAAELLGANKYEFNGAATKFASVHMVYYMASDGVSTDQMLKQASDRDVALDKVDLYYVLEMNDALEILGGEWIKDPTASWGDDSKKLHPDFIWMAVDHVGYWESQDDTGGDNDNPFVDYFKVRALLDCSNDPATCAVATTTGGGETTPPDPDPEPSGEPSCAGYCGTSSPVPGSDPACYCDDLCKDYGDCCADIDAVCD